MDRLCELLGKVIWTLSTDGGEIRSRLHEARDDIFLLNPDDVPGDDEWAVRLRSAILEARAQISGGGYMDISEEEASDIAKRLVEVYFALCDRNSGN